MEFLNLPRTHPAKQAENLRDRPDERLSIMPDSTENQDPKAKVFYAEFVREVLVQGKDCAEALSIGKLHELAVPPFTPILCARRTPPREDRDEPRVPATHSRQGEFSYAATSTRSRASRRSFPTRSCVTPGVIENEIFEVVTAEEVREECLGHHACFSEDRRTAHQSVGTLYGQLGPCALDDCRERLVLAHLRAVPQEGPHVMDVVLVREQVGERHVGALEPRSIVTNLRKFVLEQLLAAQVRYVPARHGPAFLSPSGCPSQL